MWFSFLASIWIFWNEMIHRWITNSAENLFTFDPHLIPGWSRAHIRTLLDGACQWKCILKSYHLFLLWKSYWGSTVGTLAVIAANRRLIYSDNVWLFLLFRVQCHWAVCSVNNFGEILSLKLQRVEQWLDFILDWTI